MTETPELSEASAEAQRLRKRVEYLEDSLVGARQRLERAEATFRAALAAHMHGREEAHSSSD